jgi:hypothetical protein
MDHVEQLKSALLKWWLAVMRLHNAPERSATYAIEFNSANAERQSTSSAGHSFDFKT